jgi:hypothetical protein
METAFRRYRIMSFVTGTTLLTLFAMLLLHWVDLSLWKHLEILVRIDGIAHGIVMYPLYMIASFNMVLKFRLPLALLLLDVARRILARRRVLPRAPDATAPLSRRTARQMSSPWLERRVIAFAHQGGSFEGPSSTLAAIDRALAEGATAIELDVHATSRTDRSWSVTTRRSIARRIITGRSRTSRWPSCATWTTPTGGSPARRSRPMANRRTTSSAARRRRIATSGS